MARLGGSNRLNKCHLISAPHFHLSGGGGGGYMVAFEWMTIHFIKQIYPGCLSEEL